MVARIESLPRRSSERQIAFGRMHGRLAAAALDHPAVAAWEDRFRRGKLQTAEDEALFDRELFYAIQPRERLLSLAGQYETEFSGA